MLPALLVLAAGCDLSAGSNADLDAVHAGTPSCSSAACHPGFTASGTVFTDLEAGSPLADAELRLTDSSGRTTFLATSTELGLFYSLERLPAGAVTFQLGDQRSADHQLPATADCNLCHRPGGDQGALGALVATDHIPPEVLLSTPADQAEGVDTLGAFEILLSEPLDVAGLSAASLHLEGDEGSVELAIIASEQDSRLYLRPLEELQEGAGYTLVLERALRDLAGNHLASQQRIDFQTGGDRGPRVLDSSPASGESGVDPERLLQVWFRAPLQASSVSEDSASLDTTCAPLGAAVSYDSEEAMIELEPRLPLTEGRSCALWLEGLRSEGGAAQEGPTLLVFQTWPDHTAPEAEAILPTPDTRRVPPGSAVQLRFDEELDPDSLSAEGLLVEYDSVVVLGELELHEDGRTLTWSADEGLPAGEQVLLRLDTTPTDLSGNEAQVPSWGLTIGTAEDRQPPRITGTTPGDGSTDNDPDTQPRLALSEAPDLRSFDAELITLSCSGADQQLLPSYDSELVAIELQLFAPLPSGSFCELGLGAGLADLSGNTRTESESIFFGVAGGGGEGPPVFAGVESLEATSETALQASWSAASDDSTPRSELIYRLYLSDVAGGQDFSVPESTTAPGETSAEFEDLDYGSTWYLVVRAEDADGNEDDNVVELSATTWPPTSFNDTVLPILIASCHSCHGDERIDGDLDVSSYDLVMSSGTVTPYSSSTSALVTKGNHHASGWFTTDESADIATWIDQGALDN
ncbi:MAG TPA: Ig-like domain-containing protein [Myxococcota bacterium]|nr:Ig-like domain-containing protein [Myxococcota bacterium]